MVLLGLTGWVSREGKLAACRKLQLPSDVRLELAYAAPRQGPLDRKAGDVVRVLPAKPSGCHMKIVVTGHWPLFISAAMELGLSVHASGCPYCPSTFKLTAVSICSTRRPRHPVLAVKLLSIPPPHRLRSHPT